MRCRSASASSARASSGWSWAASGDALGSEVVVLEALPDFLPMADQQVAKEALRHFKKQGLDVRLGAKVTGATGRRRDGVNVNYTDAKGEQSLEVDKVVVAIGRRPLHEGSAGRRHRRASSTSAASSRWTTSAAPVPKASGRSATVVRGPMLAHKGKEEGVMVADLIAGQFAEVNYKTVPSVIYTAPEIAWVGQTEEQVKASGREYKTGVFPFLASGRARAMEATAGLCQGDRGAGRRRDPRRAHHRPDGGRADRRSGAGDGVFGQQRRPAAHDSCASDAVGSAARGGAGRGQARDRLDQSLIGGPRIGAFLRLSYPLVFPSPRELDLRAHAEISSEILANV